jgi:phospholipase/carboxylesterase
MPVWFDRWDMGPHAKEDPDGLAETGKTVRGLIKQLGEQGINDKQIVLGGFSMGGGTSLYTTMAAPQDPSDMSLLGLAGAFSLSSWVTSESTMWVSLDQQKEASAASAASAEGSSTQPLRVAPPIFLAHGSFDSMISPAWGEATRDGLRARGVEVGWLLEDGIAHQPGPQMLTALQKWLLNTIPA